MSAQMRFVFFAATCGFLCFSGSSNPASAQSKPPVKPKGKTSSQSKTGAKKPANKNKPKPQPAKTSFLDGTYSSYQDNSERGAGYFISQTYVVAGDKITGIHKRKDDAGEWTTKFSGSLLTFPPNKNSDSFSVLGSFFDSLGGNVIGLISKNESGEYQLSLEQSLSGKFGHGVRQDPKKTEENEPPDLSADFDMAGYTGLRNGKFPFCFKDVYSQKYAANDNNHGGFWFEDSDATGHKYLEINPIGSNPPDAASAAKVLKENIATLFPRGGATNKTHPGSGIKVGDIYELTGLPVEIKPVVKCIKDTPYSFTFEATGQHILSGTALHGVFQDSCGQLWMFQEGRGVPDEWWTASKASRIIAYQFMWDELADNLHAKLRN